MQCKIPRLTHAWPRSHYTTHSRSTWQKNINPSTSQSAATRLVGTTFSLPLQPLSYLNPTCTSSRYKCQEPDAAQFFDFVGSTPIGKGRVKQKRFEETSLDCAHSFCKVECGIVVVVIILIRDTFHGAPDTRRTRSRASCKVGFRV